MTLAIKRSGADDAPPIIFLHGLGVSSWMWTEQIEALQQSYQCLAIDLPGSGDSHTAPWTSFAATASTIAAIIRERGKDGAAHVVGLSLGGYTALHLLAQHPETVLSMVVSGVTLDSMVPSWMVNPVSAMMPPILKSKVAGRVTSKLMQLPADALPIYFRDQQRLSASMAKRVYQEVLGGTIERISAESTAKLLVTAGAKEAKPILRSLSVAQERLPNATVAVAPNAHHAWNAEYPDLFTDTIDQWISQRTVPEALTLHHQARPKQADLL